MAEFERFSHQTEDDSVLSGLIAGSHGVDPDFITGALVPPDPRGRARIA